MSNKLQKPIANRPHDPMALAKLVGDIATGQVVDEAANRKLPKPSASLSTAAQCRAMGIHVGDTIEGRETYNDGAWSESRLTLLWLGEEIAVWRSYVRFDDNLEWDDRGENADWTLECRDWRMTETNQQGMDFWQRCAEVGCVVIAVRVFKKYGDDGNTHAENFVGIRFAAMPVDNDAVGPDYYFQIEEGQSGQENLHGTAEAALAWYEAKRRQAAAGGSDCGENDCKNPP